jgi:hypothetical protein
MRRLLLLAAVLAAPAALATGERILLTGSAEAFKETLCISMNCVAGGARDFTVAVRPGKGSVEVTVTSASGQHRLSHVAPLNDEGRVSSTDLVRATSLVVQAIEKGPVAGSAPAKKAVAAKKKARPVSLLANR